MTIVTILIMPSKIYAQSEQADEKLITDTLITILNPFIEKEIDHYYGYPKQYGLYDANILNVIRKVSLALGLTFKLLLLNMPIPHHIARKSLRLKSVQLM